MSSRVTVRPALEDMSEADRWLIVASQRPITLSANTTPSGAAGWKTLPSWAILAAVAAVGD